MHITTWAEKRLVQQELVDRVTDRVQGPKETQWEEGEGPSLMLIRATSKGAQRAQGDGNKAVSQRPQNNDYNKKGSTYRVKHSGQSSMCKAKRAWGRRHKVHAT